MYSENEEQLISILAKYFIENGTEMSISRLKKLNEYSDKSFKKLHDLSLVRYVSRDDIEISPSLVIEAERLKQPVNHFEEAKSWWFSKKWAVVLTIIFVLLPAIKTYIDIISYIFQ
ncbi:hypothetical protein AB4238_03115 [Shewanella sp. 10N.286.45.A1]|uniref:hypothetical protein n=1 Tax=Shewanella sp. 10N.286.45.A1 TaxID=3229694 RepID=UPI0035504218